MIMEALSAHSLAYHIPRSFTASSVSLPFSKYLPLLPPPASSFHGRHMTMMLGRRRKHANFVVKAARARYGASAIGELLTEVQIVTYCCFPFHPIAYMQTQKARLITYWVCITVFNPASARVFSKFDSLLKGVKNNTISAIPDDRSSVLQQGGMYVLKGRNLLYARKDEGTGDHAPMDEILNLCCSVPVA